MAQPGRGRVRVGRIRRAERAARTSVFVEKGAALSAVNAGIRCAFMMCE